MISLWKRELRSLCCSVVGFLYLAAALFLFGLYFYVVNLYQGSARVSTAFASCVYLFVVTVPVLTMRSFAQEFRDKTDQLLFASPVPLWKIVLGKYLAMVTLFLIPVVLAAFLPLFLLSYGDVALTEAYTTLFGYCLYGLAAIAIGMLISSLTDNTVIAAVLTAVTLFLAYTLGGFGELFGISFISKFFSAFHMQERFSALQNGVIDLRAILYFLTVGAGAVLLTILRLSGKRGRVLSKRIAYPVIVCAVVVILNIAASFIPDSVMVHDVTRRDFQLLTDQTKNFLTTLDQEVTIYIYSSEKNADENVVKMIRSYSENDKITVEYVDPETDSRFAFKYTKNSLSEGSLVITSGDRFRVISENKIYTYSDPDMESYGFSPDGFDLEGQVTSAIDYVTTKNLPKIYEITGHDELLLAGSFLTAVNRENVEVSELSLVAAGKIPADARGLLILAPKEDYSEEEIGLLRTYMEKGGNLYVLLQWSEEPKERLNSFLSEYGIKVENGIVSEGDANLYFQEPYYLIPEIQETSVTEGLSGSMALSVMSVGMKVENEAAEIILKTTDHAFLKKSSETEEQSGKEEGDETGEFVLGVFLKKTVDVTEDSGDKTGAKVTRDAKLSVFASPYMTQETTNDAISGMNQKLFIQILGEMVSHKTPISIPTKAYTPRFVTVSESDSRFFGTILAGIIPGLTLIAGLVIWVVRRRR